MAGSQNSPSYIQILRKIEVCAVYIKIKIILILYSVLQVFTIHIIVKQKLRSGYKHIDTVTKTHSLICGYGNEVV